MVQQMPHSKVNSPANRLFETLTSWNVCDLVDITILDISIYPIGCNRHFF